MTGKASRGVMLGLALVLMAAPVGAPAFATAGGGMGTRSQLSNRPQRCSGKSAPWKIDECPGERWNAGLKVCVCTPSGNCSPIEI
jgi:hypothetical protein